LKGVAVAGVHTLAETERQITEKLGDLTIDFRAMAVASNLFRAATAVRNHFERNVLAKHDLSWTAFVVLWVVWIWEPIETRQIAEEGGFSKATLTGVLTTLESRGLLLRRKSDSDGRLVLVDLTDTGRHLMKGLFPEFNAGEVAITSSLDLDQKDQLADMLRSIIAYTELK
jgi:DNA-binding MarR family transcriptional regulator